jgi:S1-C subfamily serine protease
MIEVDSFITGTGFVLNRQDIIVTSAHVISEGKTICFISYGNRNKYKLKVIKNLPASDLCILQSDKPLPVNPFRSDHFPHVQVDDSITVIGYMPELDSLLHEQTTVMCEGIYSGKAVYPHPDAQVKAHFIEFFATPVHGCSGGPILDKYGYVIAVLREAWIRKAIGCNTAIEFNMSRAFSLTPALVFIEN